MAKWIKRHIQKVQALKNIGFIKYISQPVLKDGECLIYMEFMGGSISNFLRIYKAFTEKLVRLYVIQIISALDILHQNDLYHGDLKCSNLFVDELGTVKLSDFAFLKTMKPGTIPGSEVYDPPEAKGGEVDW